MPLRAATLSDLDALVALENRCFAHDRISRRSWRRFLGSPRAFCLVATVAGGVAGAVVLLFRSGSGIARLYSMAVDPDQRRRGIAAELLRAAEQMAQRRHARAIRLEVRPDNRAALAFYAGRDYATIGVYPGFYEDGAKAVRMEKQLVQGRRR